MVAQIFGVRYLAMLSGFTFFSHQIGSFLGAWLGGKLYDTTGSYDVVWYLSIALGIVAGLINLPIDERAIKRPAAAAGVTPYPCQGRLRIRRGCVNMSTTARALDAGIAASRGVHSMTDIVIVGALRTAIGKFGGTLAKVPAPELGATVIRALLAQSGVKPEQVSEVILGQVLAAGSGQNPARQALIKSGIPQASPGDDHQRRCADRD